MDDFKTHIAPIVTKFMKSRQTKFAKSKNVSIENIHAHNQLPIWFLIKQFKSQNNIRSRLFRSLTDEQKITWFDYYDQHKQLVLMTTAEHEQFHKSHIFDIKSGEWKNINPSIEPEKSKVSSHASVEDSDVKQMKTPKSKVSSHASVEDSDVKQMKTPKSKNSIHASVEDSDVKQMKTPKSKNSIHVSVEDSDVKQMKTPKSKTSSHASVEDSKASTHVSVENSDVKVNMKQMKTPKSKVSSTHKKNLLNEDSGDSSENETNEKHVERNKNETNKPLTHSPAHSKSKKKV